jgi:hypothetical protein
MTEWGRTIHEIESAAERRAQADQEKEKATEDLRTFIKAARFAGVPITQIASAARLSRQAVYDVLGAQPSA